MAGEDVKGVGGDNSFEFPSEGKQRNGVVADGDVGTKKDLKIREILSVLVC